MKPLFVHPVKGTDWHVVVTDDAGHFYFNSRTKSSVWQLADVGPGVAENINYDEIGVLSAKARGLDVRKKLGEKVREMEEEKVEDVEEEEDIEDEFEQDVEEEGGDDDLTMALLRDVMAEHNVEIESHEEAADDEESQHVEVEDVEVPLQTLIGVALGYSSSDESESDEEQDKMIGSRDSQETEYAATANSDADNDDVAHSDDSDDETYADDEIPLDLSLPTQDDPAAIEAFKSLLDSHKSSISIYDPWFIVEEDLLPKVANDPAYYGVGETQRESVYNAWVSDNSTTETSQIYPTSELLFFQLLQNNKSDVKTLYYSEYLAAHSEVANFLPLHPHLNGEVLYRQLRLTLNDFAKYERESKKHRKTGKDKITGNDKNSGNLKVAHLENFLYAHRSELPRCGAVTTGCDFDQWIQLLNFGVPTAIAHDTINFIVGDEKRLACYRRAMAGLDA